MLHRLWVACLIITLFTLSDSCHIGPRDLQPSAKHPLVVSPNSVRKIKGNGKGSPFFNAANFPPPTIIVRQQTTHPREFRTIQGAVNSLRNRTGPQVIYVHDGVYREQVRVDYGPPLIIRGRKPNDSGQNFVSLIFSLSAKEAKSNQASATLNVLKDDFGLYFFNVTNEFGTGTDTQALALNAKGDRLGFYSSTFTSFQDTVRVYRGVQIFSLCHISGAVDFFFGRYSNVWLERVSIPIRKANKAPITANGKHPDDNSGFFVFNNATIFSAGALPQTAFLGRPWGNGAHVAYQFSNLSDVIHPDGWMAWNPSDPRTESVQFQEYGNFGPGAEGERLLETPLAFPHIPENVLGPDYRDWIDNFYRPIINIPEGMITENTLAIKKNTKPTLHARPRRPVSLQ